MNAQEVEQWLRTKLATRLRVSPESIDVHRPLDQFGIDSIEAVNLTGELEGFLGRRVEPTAFWDYRTPSALARALAGEGSETIGGMTQGMSDDEVDALLRKLQGAR